MAKKEKPQDQIIEGAAINNAIDLETRRVAQQNVAKRMSAMNAQAPDDAPRTPRRLETAFKAAEEDRDPVVTAGAQAIESLYSFEEELKQQNLGPELADKVYNEQASKIEAAIDARYDAREAEIDQQLNEVRKPKLFSSSGEGLTEKERENQRRETESFWDWHSNDELAEVAGRISNGEYPVTPARLQAILAALRQRGMDHEFRMVRQVADSENLLDWANTTQKGRELLANKAHLSARPRGHLWARGGVDLGGVWDLGPRKK